VEVVFKGGGGGRDDFLWFLAIDFSQSLLHIPILLIEEKSPVMAATSNYSPPPPEEQLVTNMLLLGFDREASEKRFGVTLKPDMFHGCNVKGMEVVFHFLFSKINPEVTREVRFLWILKLAFFRNQPSVEPGRF
jgi:hypothetical protein